MITYDKNLNNYLSGVYSADFMVPTVPDEEVLNGNYAFLLRELKADFGIDFVTPPSLTTEDEFSAAALQHHLDWCAYYGKTL